MHGQAPVGWTQESVGQHRELDANEKVVGHLTGRFGRRPKYWAERMLDEGLVHILATDSHHIDRRPPLLAEGRDAAAARVGAQEAMHLVQTRPQGIIDDLAPDKLPPLPERGVASRSGPFWRRWFGTA